VSQQFLFLQWKIAEEDTANQESVIIFHWQLTFPSIVCSFLKRRNAHNDLEGNVNMENDDGEPICSCHFLT
jgi:hypothetical protein